MKLLLFFLLSVFGLAAAATFGNYIPKAFYIIDENGNPTAIKAIEAVKRVRRQIQPFQPFGNQPFGFQPLNIPNLQPGPGTQGTSISTFQTLDSRFGDDEPKVHTVVQHHKDGHVQTSHYSSGGQKQRTKRQEQSQLQSQNSDKGQQTQIQSQDGKDGKQIQSQNQQGSGGSQFQSQSQGPSGHESPAAGQQFAPVGDNRNDINNIPQGGQQHPQGGQQPHQGGQQYPQGGQEHPQGVQQPHQGGQQYPQGGQQYPQDNQQYGQGGQQQYPQQTPPQGGYQPIQPFNGFGAAPFGFGGFGQQGFPFAQGFGPGFGQPGFGGNPGFGFGGFGFQQPGFGGPAPNPGIAAPIGGPVLSGTLDNRFGENEPVITQGATQTITSQNGNFHATTTVLKPDGQVQTTHHTGHLPKKP